MTPLFLLFSLGGTPHLPAAFIGETPEASVMALKGSRKFWLNRDWGTNSQDAITALEAAREVDGENYKIRFNLARFYYWEAVIASDDSTKGDWAKKAWDEAEEAKRIRPGGVEGWYWASASIGEYSKAMGIGTAVKEGLADKFKSNALKAIEIDRAHDEGGPLRALGRFHSQLPWPLQDLDESRKLLEAASGVSRSAVNLYFLGDTELMDGNGDAAKPIFEECAVLDPAQAKDPPATRRNKKRCEEAVKGL